MQEITIISDVLSYRALEEEVRDLGIKFQTDMNFKATSPRFKFQSERSRFKFQSEMPFQIKSSRALYMLCLLTGLVQFRIYFVFAT